MANIKKQCGLTFTCLYIVFEFSELHLQAFTFTCPYMPVSFNLWFCMFHGRWHRSSSIQNQSKAMVFTLEQVVAAHNKLAGGTLELRDRVVTGSKLLKQHHEKLSNHVDCLLDLKRRIEILESVIKADHFEDQTNCINNKVVLEKKEEGDVITTRKRWPSGVLKLNVATLIEL